MNFIRLKEIIQNADDARATVVKFYLDYRNIPTLPKTLTNYPDLDKFRGPALMSFNDAPFSPADWEGIQSMHDSIKAKDPSKVGKFGIGFNSVYHITGLF